MAALHKQTVVFPALQYAVLVKKVKRWIYI